MESIETGVVSINVKEIPPPPVNNPPIAIDKTVETNSNTSVSIKLEGRDTDQGDSISRLPWYPVQLTDKYQTLTLLHVY